ncbi:F0F1 ATP synthase subunit gamma [Nostoc muscorum FACHB-395]|jgi:F-type H+-transporting ATPase subunit gamma|nr:F0F1 ATP synthase subunit gamma [Desmonostoc muscorum FACHB-395]
MPALESLQRQIATAQELQSVVKTMKVLAAASIRQYERAVESLTEYTCTIEMGLQIVLGEGNHRAIASTAAQCSKNPRLGVILFGSDQGMCGQFNEQIAQYAVTQIQYLSISSTAQIKVLAVGARVISALEAAGVAIEENSMMPTSLAGITSMVQEILLHIEMWESQLQINEIVLFYNKPHSNTSCEPHTLQLLPIDETWLQNLQQQKWLGPTLPTFTMDWSQLFSALVKQYLFISIYRAFAESLASENASRLASMQASEQNIEEQLAQLNAQFQHERQTAITEEMLEIASGFEALTGMKGSG